MHWLIVLLIRWAMFFHLVLELPISFGGVGLHSMEDCAPFALLRSLALVPPYLCSRFCIFDKFVSEEYFFGLKGAHNYFNHAYV